MKSKNSRKRIKSFLINIVIVVAMIVNMQGCVDGVQFGSNFLNKPPNTNFTIDSLFSSAFQAKKLLWNAYKVLPYRWGGNTGGPLGRQSQYSHLNYDILASLTDVNQSFLIWASVITRYYNPSGQVNYRFAKFNYHGWSWRGIRQAYTFIENVHRVPDMSEVTKKRLKAEARMIIAVWYTDLWRNFGGVPWVGGAILPGEKVSRPRLTAKATMDSILAVINRAIPYLPFTLKQPQTQSGRFTKASAMGLKCRVRLFGASPLFNSPQPYMEGLAAGKKLSWYGGKDPTLWKKAAQACHAFIIANKKHGMPYHLVENPGNPQKAFFTGYYKRTSPEILISTRRNIFKRTNNYGGSYAGPALQGSANTTDNYVKMFPMASGIPIKYPNSGYDPTHPYKNRDPRLAETVLYNGHSYRGRTAELWIGGRERKTKSGNAFASGYRMYKFLGDLISGDNNGTVTQFPYLRLSEIYLSYAEALNQVNNGPTQEAYKYVNKVRNRVGLCDLQKIMHNVNSQKEFRKKVLRERVLELGYERVRWYDMVRWKMKKTFTKPLYGMNICKKGVSPPGACKDNGLGYAESNEYIYSRFRLPVRHWQKVWSPKWYLSSFPQSQVRLGITQNPGWVLSN